MTSYSDTAVTQRVSSHDTHLAACAAERRRVILSTPIAESSLTIDGVRIVVDGGYARAPRFDSASGMEKMQTLRISRSSAQQRTGRAGDHQHAPMATAYQMAKHALPLRRE